MIYIDTSVWVAQHTLEAKTETVHAWMATQDIETFVCAQWVKTEFAHALSTKLRNRAFDTAHFELAHRQFAAICVAGPRWVSLDDADFLEAAGMCTHATSAMRAGDALHLAVARRVRCHTLCSLDAVLNRNAAACGLQTVLL